MSDPLTDTTSLREIVGRSNTSLREDARYHFGQYPLSPDEARTFFIIEPLGEIMAAAMSMYSTPHTSSASRDAIVHVVAGLHAAGMEATKSITRSDLRNRTIDHLHALGTLMSAAMKHGHSIH